jgi:hypothetical protein
MELSPLEKRARDPLIEVYLGEVSDRLPHGMTPVCRLEQRAELRDHLEALVDAHQELGADEDRAVLAALKQFGSAEELGHRLSQEWKRSAHVRASAGELVTAAGVCLGMMSVWGLYSGWPTVDLGLGAFGPAFDALLPCVAGYFWARRFPRFGSPGIALLAALLAAAMLPLPPEYQGLTALHLAARALLVMKWAIVGGGAAGLTVTLRALADRWRKRRLA